MRRAAGVRGPQLSHYLANKESLVRAVIDWQAESVLGFHRSERFAGFDTIEVYQEGADFFVLSGRPFENGRLGSPASEISRPIWMSATTSPVFLGQPSRRRETLLPRDPG
ncbi:hypothetical protein [Streptomyces sp. MK5]|uniref:hypothetical protein n=1 Tax=Streptomyces sp. MK5 TaxID=3064253 RepID=UPI0027413163|nr:hypothetical protein [Streptomyces sp. MK5]